MDHNRLKNVLEALIFVTQRPLPLAELSEVTGEDEEGITAVIEEMRKELEENKSALQIMRVGEGFQMATREGFGYWVKKLFREQTTFRLSQSALETLSIVAYKQPITRGEIEEIRGVEVIGVLDTLLERRLVKVAGRKETVGRPLLYATTPEFLRHFNLWKVSDLPSLEDLAKEQERKAMAESNAVPVAAGVPESAAEAEGSAAPEETGVAEQSGGPVAETPEEETQ